MITYNETVEAYFFRPPRDFSGHFAGAAGGNVSGISIEFRASVTAAEKLADLGFRAFACPHIIAACEWLAETLEGQPVDALAQIDWPELQQTFDIPVEKAGKLLIIQDAITKLLADIDAQTG